MAGKALSPKQFRNQLLAIMDLKDHWAWTLFASGSLSKQQLKIHFQQEYGVYVRDFPVFLARIYGQNPPMDVRRKLAQNIFEEDTGQLSLGTAHPELFLKMMKGLGFKNGSFKEIALLPTSRRYRAWLDRISVNPNWTLGAAVLTIFVEGSLHDRTELAKPTKRRTPREIEARITSHPLVRYHGLSPAHMDLSRAHQLVENGHRHDAYDMVANYSEDRKRQNEVVATLKKTLVLWLQYRDGIARACGLQPKTLS